MTICRAARVVKYLMQRGLNTVQRWGSANGLTFNPIKTQCAVFTGKRKELKMRPLTMDGVELEISPEIPRAVVRQ